MALLRFA